MQFEPATVLGLLIEIGEADELHEWYLNALIPLPGDRAHAKPDPQALAHLDTSTNLTGLEGWGLYQDATCAAVYTSDNRLHREHRSENINLCNSIREAVSLCIETLYPVLPPLEFEA